MWRATRHMLAPVIVSDMAVCFCCKQTKASECTHERPNGSECIGIDGWDSARWMAIRWMLYRDFAMNNKQQDLVVQMMHAMPVNARSVRVRISILNDSTAPLLRYWRKRTAQLGRESTWPSRRILFRLAKKTNTKHSRLCRWYAESDAITSCTLFALYKNLLPKTNKEESALRTRCSRIQIIIFYASEGVRHTRTSNQFREMPLLPHRFGS